MNTEQAKALRAPFPKDAIGKLPRGGTTLDYVGHAAVTDRLLQVDPGWTWAPLAYDEHGAPLIVRGPKESAMWITLTVCDVTRLGVGICASNAFELEKQLISDALRNASMRFGVALDLWSREPLLDDVGSNTPTAATEPKRAAAATPDVDAGLIEHVKAHIAGLDGDATEAFMQWKNEQNFPWPWPVAACNAMLDRLCADEPDPMEDPF